MKFDQFLKVSALLPSVVTPIPVRPVGSTYPPGDSAVGPKLTFSCSPPCGAPG